MSEQKAVLISGSSRGIGRSLAEYYLSQNYLVAGCSREAVTDLPGNYKHFSLDITDEEKVLQAFKSIRKEFGRLDILINNAGLHSINHAILTPITSARDIFNVNFLGAFLLCREAAKLMMTNRFGRIINISTVAVPLSSAGTAMYTASKAAMEQFTKVFAKEVADYGITINTLGLPILKDVGMSKNISEQAKQKTLENLTFKNPAEIKDITHALDFLISSEARMVTRQTIYLGGI